MIAPMGRTIVIALALVSLSGCRERDPADVARDFLDQLRDYQDAPSPGRLEQLWGLLSEQARAPLEARAQAASQTLGVKVAPWELVRFDGFVAGDRVSRVETLAVADTKARVTVSYAWAFKPSAGGPASTPVDGELALVLESDGWRVALALAERPAASATPAEGGPP